MKCEVCGKKKATVHLTELIDDQVSELHICEDCAREKSLQMEQQFGLADLLAGLSDFGKPMTEKSQQPAQIVQCPNCQITYEDFKKHGRLGCSECYQAFERQLGTLLKKIHGASKHVGKAPVGTAPDKADQASAQASSEKAVDIEQMKKHLQQAVLSEDYERAAQLRDKIRSIEQQGQGGHGTE